MREPHQDTTYDLVHSPIMGEFSVRLWVPVLKLKAGLNLSAGTELKAFMASHGLDKGDLMTKGFGLHVLTDTPGESAGGWVSFWFCAPKTDEEKAVAFRETESLEASVDWPPVLTGLTWNAINRYQEPGGGSTYTERVNWQPVFKRFDGLTQVVKREFFAPTKFEIELPAQMRPEGFLFDYVLGRFELERCLHTAYEFDFSTGTSDWYYPLIESYLLVPATNYTDWPDEVIIADGQAQVAGGWLRTQLVAKKPVLPGGGGA